MVLFSNQAVILFNTLSDGLFGEYWFSHFVCNGNYKTNFFPTGQQVIYSDEQVEKTPAANGKIA